MRLNTKFFITLAALLLVPNSSVNAGAADDQSVSAPGGSALLATLLREAMERNPEIQAARRAIDAKRARIPQARAWPDPKLSFSYAGNPLPFSLMSGDPSSNRQIMAEQEIPYPGKTRLRGQIASQEADAETFAYEGVWRRVVAEVKQAYFDLYFVDQSLAILDKDRTVLDQFEKVAEVRYSVGKTSQQDVLKAQVEITKLSERRTVLLQMRQTLEAQLDSLRNFPVDTAVGAPGDLEPSPFSYSLEDLENAAQANLPALKQQRALIEGNRLAVDLARKEVRPNFSVNYAYMQRDAQPDMWGLAFSATLPIFHKSKQDRAVAEAAANVEAARRMEENELTTLRYRVKQEYLQARAAEDLLTLYAKAIMPQSSLALESSLPAYEAGTTDLLMVLSNFSTVLDYELAYREQAANHEKALARLEELTALDLVH